MVTEDKKLQLIELRANGYSFQKIAKELSISKPTAIQIAKDYETEIKNSRELAKERRLESLEIDYNNRLQNLVLIYNRVREEIISRDLSDVKTDTLIKILINLQEKIVEDKASPVLLEGPFRLKIDDQSWEV